MSAGLAEAIAAAAGGTLAHAHPVPGGDINEALQVELTDGRRLFAKHRTDPPAGFYAAEAAGLRWLGAADALPVPQVVAVDERFLALEWLDRGPAAPDAEARLGEGLARVHLAGATAHGATPDDGPTFLGPLALPGAAPGIAAPHPGRPADPGFEPGTWATFYAEHRLHPLLRLALDRDAIPAGTARRVETVIERIDALAGPPEPPARLHGDLWTGNVMTGPDGGPWLVDPAAHGGHRETDLAMLQLFGRPGPAFHDAYTATAPLAAGHEDRVALWQLQPLLVHAILFGGGYGGSVDAAARRVLR